MGRSVEKLNTWNGKCQFDMGNDYLQTYTQSDI